MNMRLCLICVALLLCLTTAVAGGYGRHKKNRTKSTDEEYPKHKYSGYTYVAGPSKSLADLPKDFTWCNTPEGDNLCAPSWNQHIPRYCGACWVHGTLSGVQDRIKIANHKAAKADGGIPVTDIMLARQTMLNCGQARGDFGAGCNGGEAFDVFEFMHRFGLPDETCNNYAALETPTCDVSAYCTNCMYLSGDAEPHCWGVPEEQTVRYFVTKYGTVSGEEAIMTEILNNGPVTCGMATPDEFCYGYHGGVWIDQTKSEDVDHDVEVVGWGEENGVKYWTIRNSWGSYWGENGWFRLQRGVNSLKIEDSCAAALVDVSQLQDLLHGKTTGSMFGTIPMDQKPEYLPAHWKSMDHKWRTSESDAYKGEATVKKNLDQIWRDSHPQAQAQPQAAASLTAPADVESSGIGLGVFLGVSVSAVAFVVLSKVRAAAKGYQPI